METIRNFMDILTGMRWSDYLDIIVVAFLIYKLLPLVRTPSTMRIARAVAAVIAIAWLTNELHLYSLSFLLNQFLSVGLIAFVVLFQPELRKMLNHLGKTRLRDVFGIKRPGQDMTDVITQTVQACEVMSRQKVGALIVFAREQGLEEYYKTGTVIDAQVSDQLLRNIFFPKAALHDGAVIIHEGRVAAAGCVLPLSDSSRLSADLGTRHRASVGMSESSDAVVVVVSEETGTISVAVGGMLKRHLAPQTLQRLLQNELCPKTDETAKQSIPQMLGRWMNKDGKEHSDYEK